MKPPSRPQPSPAQQGKEVLEAVAPKENPNQILLPNFQGCEVKYGEIVSNWRFISYYTDKNMFARVISFYIQHFEIIFDKEVDKTFLADLFFDHPISLFAFAFSFFGEKEGAPFYVPDYGICNSNSCCIKKIHKILIASMYIVPYQFILRIYW